MIEKISSGSPFSNSPLVRSSSSQSKGTTYHVGTSQILQQGLVDSGNVQSTIGLSGKPHAQFTAAKVSEWHSGSLSPRAALLCARRELRAVSARVLGAAPSWRQQVKQKLTRTLAKLMQRSKQDNMATCSDEVLYELLQKGQSACDSLKRAREAVSTICETVYEEVEASPQKNSPGLTVEEVRSHLLQAASELYGKVADLEQGMMAAAEAAVRTAKSATVNEDQIDLQSILRGFAEKMGLSNPERFSGEVLQSWSHGVTESSMTVDPVVVEAEPPYVIVTDNQNDNDDGYIDLCANMSRRSSLPSLPVNSQVSEGEKHIYEEIEEHIYEEIDESKVRSTQEDIYVKPDVQKGISAHWYENTGFVTPRKLPALPRQLPLPPLPLETTSPSFSHVPQLMTPASAPLRFLMTSKLTPPLVLPRPAHTLTSASVPILEEEVEMREHIQLADLDEDEEGYVYHWQVKDWVEEGDMVVRARVQLPPGGQDKVLKGKIMERRLQDTLRQTETVDAKETRINSKAFFKALSTLKQTLL